MQQHLGPSWEQANFRVDSDGYGFTLGSIRRERKVQFWKASSTKILWWTEQVSSLMIRAVLCRRDRGCPSPNTVNLSMFNSDTMSVWATSQALTKGLNHFVMNLVTLLLIPVLGYWQIRDFSYLHRRCENNSCVNYSLVSDQMKCASHSNTHKQLYFKHWVLRL